MSDAELLKQMERVEESVKAEVTQLWKALMRLQDMMLQLKKVTEKK